MNVFKRFERLLRRPVLRIVTATVQNGSVWYVEEMDGAITTAIGEAQAGQKFYVRENTIIGPAPNLPLHLIEE